MPNVGFVSLVGPEVPGDEIFAIHGVVAVHQLSMWKTSRRVVWQLIMDVVR